MRATNLDNTQTQLGELLQQKMEERGVALRDLSVKLEITYEHIRRIVRGEGLPSKYVLKLLCEELGLNYKEAERLVTADKIKKQYGNIPSEIANKNPEMEPIERAWPRLTTEQKSSVITMVRAWAQQNKVLQQ